MPFTIRPDRSRTNLLVYTVSAGDTLFDIAERYHITADTLVWSNDLGDNPDLLRLGQQLIILPVNGVLHTVAPGDTLDTIAKKYSVQVSDIVGYAWNHLDPQNPTLTLGQKLIVPNGTGPEPPKPASPPDEAPLEYGGPSANAPHGFGRFIWPITGMITQGFWRYHRAIDIGSYIGNPIKAADAGYVAIAGWSNEGYGYYVVLDHRNGYQTLYAHMSRILVAAGQSVSQGETIGLVGSTGNSTGPHLHFEIHFDGIQENPFNYLPIGSCRPEATPGRLLKVSVVEGDARAIRRAGPTVRRNSLALSCKLHNPHGCCAHWRAPACAWFGRSAPGTMFGRPKPSP